MPGQAFPFKAFRASFTLAVARYVAPGDPAALGDLPLGHGNAAVETVTQGDDLRLPLGQALSYRLTRPPAGLL